MLESLKQSVWAANLFLVENHLVLLTWGNVSGRDADTGLVVIKPSGVAYVGLRPEQMVVVDLDGRVVEGDLRPSSDTPTHLVLYRAFPELGGVAHTHSTHATAWAQAGRALPCYGTTHADSFRGEVPITAPLTDEALAGDYEAKTGEAIVHAFTRATPALSPREVPAALVVGHGPFTWGASAAQAAENCLILEECARMAALTEALNPAAAPLSVALRDKHFLRKHGSDAYYGQK
ncbi:MAG TPA: L-ribulose-5-phosphate 4-epimerase AraD [Armatimonadota bacterium]|jgi:L-ribulose-5-phosphate 4-epimerase